MARAYQKIGEALTSGASVNNFLTMQTQQYLACVYANATGRATVRELVKNINAESEASLTPMKRCVVTKGLHELCAQNPFTWQHMPDALKTVYIMHGAQFSHTLETLQDASQMLIDEIAAELGDDTSEPGDTQATPQLMAVGPHSLDRLAAQEAAQRAGAPPGDALERRVCHQLARGEDADEEEEEGESGVKAATGAAEAEEGEEEDTQVRTKIRINLKFAREYAQTKAAGTWGSMPYADVVAMIALQSREDVNGFGIYTIIHKESKLSEALGLHLRQQSGANKDDEDVDVPGVNKSFVGISLAGMPRDLRAAFLYQVPNTVDLDMCASDQQCVAERYPDLENVRRYGHDTKLFREELAEEGQTTIAKIKSTVTRASYDGKVTIPVGPKLKALLDDSEDAKQRDLKEHAETHEKLKDIGRPKRATLHSVVNQTSERKRLETIKRICGEHGASMPCPIFDGGIVQSREPLREENILANVQAAGINAAIKPLPNTPEEFKTFVQQYAAEKGRGEPCFEVLEHRDILALQAARRSLSTKGAVDEMAVGRAIIHELKLSFAKPEGEFKGPAPIEGWDAERRFWRPFTTDDILLLAVETALKKVLCEYAMATRTNVHAHVEVEPQMADPPERFGNLAFVSRIAKAVCVLLQPQRVLDDEVATGHMIHFECGHTLHFDKPFDEQLQWGQREDRASRSTGSAFKEWEPPAGVREKVRELCDLMAVGWAARDFTIDVEKPEDLAEALLANTEEGHHLRELGEQIKTGLEDVKQHSDILKLLFPSHGTWDPTMYELRQFARGASGCKLFEEMLIYLGRTGSNRKTTTLKLLTGTFGSSNKQGSRGYVCTQKAKYFEQKDTAGASAPDEGIAAMKSARFVVIDEFAGVTGHFNHTLVKQWTDVDGSALQFERKFGARDEIKPSWLMIWFCNELPPFDTADEAFARRPSVMPMYISFKAAENFDSGNASHMVADNTMRARAATFGPELIFWIRCLVAGLYSRTDTTVMRPRPKVGEAATAEELEVVLAKTGAAGEGDVTSAVKDFVERLVVCKRGQQPSGTKDVQNELIRQLEVDKKRAPQLLVNAGLKTRTVCVKRVNTWAYVNSNGKALVLP